MSPSLVVTIDTEEEGLWGGEYRRTGNTVENVRGIERFQQLCDGYGIRPTYLVDAPVVQTDWAVEMLRAIQDDGRCEIGAHVHPWCNPPFEEDLNSRNSYLCNLPEPLQREKIDWLTGAIAERFGRRPVSFRAGRYGLDASGARILADLGYRVDSSVIPFSDFRADGGPRFENAPCGPYVPSQDNLLKPNGPDGLLEVPVTVGYNRANFERAHAVREWTRQSPLRRLRAVGILDRLGIARRIKFSPEQADTRRMKQLVDACLTREAAVLVLMFHSSSLIPGYSPYVANGTGLEEFYRRLDTVFAYCRRERALVSRTLSELADEGLGAVAPGSPAPERRRLGPGSTPPTGRRRTRSA